MSQRKRTVEGELFGRLVASGVPAKSLASILRACNGSLSAHVLAAILQSYAAKSSNSEIFRLAISIARKGCPTDEYLQQARQLIEEAEEECRVNPYYTVTTKPRKPASGLACARQKPAKSQSECSSHQTSTCPLFEQHSQQ